MTCGACGHANPETARFCNACGTALATRCPGCGADNPPGSRFCNACGAALVAPLEPVPSRVEGPTRRTAGLEARKVVTVVFADLIGSTALHERLDAESVRSLMGRYYGALHAAVEAHGGTVVKLLGDGVMAAFGLRRVAEDDAPRAVRAAVAMQAAMRALAREQGGIGLRVAVNTGEVVVDPGTDDVVGDPVNVAARLQDAAQDGDVVIGEATRRLVGALVTLAPLGPVSLRGRAETVTAHRVVSLEPPGGASAVGFVGRDDELRRLAAVYEAARAAPAARLAVVLGSPGLGKSRLVDEFTRRLDGATVLTAHCEAAGGATFAPIAQALRAVLGLGAGTGGYDLRRAIDAAVPGTDADRSRIAAGIGALLAGTPAAPEETFFVVRRLLAGLAAGQPVVLVLDDVHWAEPLLLDLVEHLVQWSIGVPLLILAAARPELRDARSSLASPGRLATDVVMLGGLDAAAASRLAANVIGADALPAAIAGRVLTTSEGNPLFLGELVRMLVDDGALRRDGDRWTVGSDLAAVDMPPTIHALLAARIERLRVEDRLVLERAAIVGRQFSRAAVAHLLPREAHGELDARLEALRRSDLIEPDAGWFLGEPALRFHHGLIRDAAYRRVLKGTRAGLHGQVADWIASRVGDAVEHDETIGWHLEQAHRHLGELGPIDDAGRALGERAARYLAAAGRRALARDDAAVAADLLGRALERLGSADRARAELALDWCEALLSAGEVGPASAAIHELRRWTNDDASAAASRLRGWHTCFAAQLAVLTEPQTLRATADTVAAAAEALASAGDDAGEAKAHSVHAMALERLGRIGACEAALDRALAAARRADDRRRSNAVLAGAPLAALWGPGPVTRASGRCLDVVRVLRITQGAPAVEAVALRCQAVLEALRGRAEAADRMIASSRRMVEELGITQGLLETDFFAGIVALSEGDAAAAARSFRAAYDGFRTHGLGIDAARAAALLGLALLQQNRAAEAEALSHESEALAGDDLQAAITWRRVRAEALARRGEHAAAVDLARAAVDIAAATDALIHHADARQALAAALRAAGRHAEADAEEARAVELWETKGATAIAERTRQAVGRALPEERAVHSRGVRDRPVGRRVEANAATVSAARLDAAIVARDVDALGDVFAAEHRTFDHSTGTTWDWQATIATYHTLLSAEQPTCRHEPLCSLGESLVLLRVSTSASGFVGASIDVGEYDRQEIVLGEVDASGRYSRGDVFPVDRLGDAVARLYERYAELLPEGRERDRAMTTGRSITAYWGPLDRDRMLSALAPDLEYHDRRHVGFGLVRGIRALGDVIDGLFEVVDDVASRVDDVLGLRPDAALVRVTNFGTDRASGGPYERPYLFLLVTGADGRLVRLEQFDVDHEEEAVARFDEVAPGSGSAAPSSRTAMTSIRRVRPNAATANAARLDAAMRARDESALLALDDADIVVIDHRAGTTYGAAENIASRRMVLTARELEFRHEPLATLGESLALHRLSISGRSFSDGSVEAGAFDVDTLVVSECDAAARCRRAEIFAGDRLGDAVVRLYERYAELLPDGPVRERAAATARSLALPVRRPLDLDGYAAALAPAVAFVDHRPVGLPPSRAREDYLRGLRALVETTEGSSVRVDDVLGLRPDAVCIRAMHSGTLRDGGGAWERPLLVIWVCGADGLLTHMEFFDADRDAEALARFDALAPGADTARHATRRVRPNAATVDVARFQALIAARDVDAITEHCAASGQMVDHKNGAVYDRESTLRVWLTLASSTTDARYLVEPLATLGDSLGLFRQWTSGTGFTVDTFDVGAFEAEQLLLVDADGAGRRRATEIFAPDRLDEALVRLYERYAALLPHGPARARMVQTAASISAHVGALDLGRFVAALAPDVEYVDHRRMVGFGRIRGIAGFREALATLFEATEDPTNRVDEVLAARPDAALVRVTNVGTQRSGGGRYERAFVALWTFGADGRVSRTEQFDVVDEAAALARLDELTAEGRPARPVRRRVRPNRATASVDRLDSALAARDAGAIASLHAENMRTVHHVTGTILDRQGVIDWWRAYLGDRDLSFHTERLATLADSLALIRLSWRGSASDDPLLAVGGFAGEELDLLQVDAEGRVEQAETFGADHLSDAVARMYERHAEILADGSARAGATALARSVAAALGPYDLARYATCLAPDIRYVDRRTLGLGTADGKDATLRLLGTMLEVADHVTNRIDDVLAQRTDAVLLRWTNSGTDRVGGGAYERHFLWLGVFGPDGLVGRIEAFDADRTAEALARFDELATASPVARIETTATRLADRMRKAVEARDWERIAAVHAPGCRMIERRRMVRLELDRDAQLESIRFALEMRGSRLNERVLATRGDKVALTRGRWEASDADAGPSELEFLQVSEVDVHGAAVALVAFDLDDLDAAYAELDARYLAGEAAPYARTWEAYQRIPRAVAARDWARTAAAFAPGAVMRDHRPLGLFSMLPDESLSADRWVASVRALFEMRPDTRFRLHHVLALDDRRSLTVQAWEGAESEGAFETPSVFVTSYGAEGIRQIDAYGVDQLDAARACYDRLAATVPPCIENAATRAFQRAFDALRARDREGFAALFALGFRGIDRRKMLHNDLGRDEWLGSYREIIGMTSSECAKEVLATRGDRLMLGRYWWRGTDGVVGPSEIEYLLINEVDDRGDHVATVMFDPDHLDAAYAELDERYGAGEAAPHAAGWQASLRFFEALASRSWEELAATLAPGFAVEDHRPVGLLAGLARDEYVASLRALVGLRPDARFRLEHVLALDDRRVLGVARWTGDDSDGAFATPVVAVSVLGPDGARRHHFYNLDQLDEAWARYDALGSDALHVPPNAATGADDRF